MELCRGLHNSIFSFLHASNLLNILRLNIVFVLIHGQRYNFLSQISGNSYKFCCKSWATGLQFCCKSVASEAFLLCFLADEFMEITFICTSI